MNTTKMSILMLYLRIFIQRWFRITCYVLFVIIASYMMAAFFASVFQCTPVTRAWDKTIAGSCIDITTNWYANAGFSIATNIIILALPMYPIYKKTPLKRKIALMVVFALGVFVAVTSILRMQTLNFSSTSPDTTYDIASSVCTITEKNVAIICACLPMMWAPLARLFPSFFSTSQAADSHVSLAVRSSGHNSTSRPRSDWAQLHGSSHVIGESDINQISDSGNRSSEDSMGQTLPPAQRGEIRHQDAKRIQKVTEYQVSYSSTESPSA